MTEDELRMLQHRIARKSGKSIADIWIGIDPGVNTGVAVWRSSSKRFLSVEGMKAVEAEILVLNYWNMSLATMSKEEPIDVHVVVEDTRKLRLPAKLQNNSRLKGAGSVHRDMGRWQEYLEHHGIPHTMAGLAPKAFREGDDKWFRELTGWASRTNEHGRCAAGLVYEK